jgi:ADP-heptose:LPS heptosyltransferase
MHVNARHHIPMSDRRALVLFPGALGDFVCFLPTIKILAERMSIDLLARTEFSELVPGRVKVGSLERFEIRHLFISGGGSDDKVRRFFETYECTYSWMGSGDLTFKREVQAATQGRVRLFQFHSRESQMHQADYYRSCLRDDSIPSMPHIPLTPDANQWAEAYWVKNSLNSTPVLAIAPGSGAREKNWPVTAFAAMARWWRERIGGSVIIILGPVEEERGAYESLCSHGIVVRGITLGRLAAVIARCSLYVGNDSGISHLAAALGVPTAAVFGPSNVDQWAPRGTVLVFRHEVPCSPCAVSVMKNCRHHECLAALAAAEVIRQLERWPPLVTLTSRGPGIRVRPEILPELLGG